MGEVVVIDDERTFFVRRNPLDQTPEPIYLRTSEAGLAYLADHWANYFTNSAVEPIRELWLDHDLGEGDDIRRVVKFLYVAKTSRHSAKAPWIENIFIHSQNPTASDYVIQMLGGWFPNVERTALPNLTNLENGS